MLEEKFVDNPNFTVLAASEYVLLWASNRPQFQVNVARVKFSSIKNGVELKLEAAPMNFQEISSEVRKPRKLLCKI